MNLYRAIEHFQKRLGQGSIEVNDYDLIAFNEIIEFVNNATQNALETNTGFAKLYIWAYGYLLEDYKTDVFDKIPQKQLHRLLDQPLDYFIDKFMDRINDIEREALLSEFDFPEGHPATFTEEQEAQNTKAAKALDERIKSNEDDMKRLNGSVYERKYIEEQLMNVIGKALIQFKL